MRFLIIHAIIVAAVFIWWRFFYIARPAVPPLRIDPDDPLMREARAKAKESIPRFRELAGQPNRGIRVKIPFVSSSGTTEYLWAEVLSFRDHRWTFVTLRRQLRTLAVWSVCTHMLSPIWWTGRSSLSPANMKAVTACVLCLFAGVKSGAVCHQS